MSGAFAGKLIIPRMTEDMLKAYLKRRAFELARKGRYSKALDLVRPITKAPWRRVIVADGWEKMDISSRETRELAVSQR